MKIPAQILNLMKIPIQISNLMKIPTQILNLVKIPTQILNLTKIPTQLLNLMNENPDSNIEFNEYPAQWERSFSMRTDWNDETNNRFSPFREKRL